jgi:hypothetical protein
MCWDTQSLYNNKKAGENMKRNIVGYRLNGNLLETVDLPEDVVDLFTNYEVV